MLDPVEIACPYCGEINEIEVDPSGGRHQSYNEDCQVCCRPWRVKVRIGAGGRAQVRLFTEDEVGDEGNQE